MDKRKACLAAAAALSLSLSTGFAAGDGVYAATAKGFGGDVTVTLSIQDGKLVDVTAEGAAETDGVGSRAIELMPGAMLAGNTVETDGVSGATVTSTAILEAAKAALAESNVTLAAQQADVEQHMTPGTYVGEAYGKWKKGSIEGERFGSPAIIQIGRASFVGVTPNGEINIEDIALKIKENTALVSILYVNNEIGTISDVEAVSALCRNNNIAFHSDLTQALGKMQIDIKKMGIDYASCSAHKIYGPKGIGAAFMKFDAYGIAPITALMHGGEQEFGFRAGTHAVHNIVGFGKAAEIALRDLKKNEVHIKRLDEMLLKGIATIDNIHTTVDSSKRVPGIISLVVDKSDFHNERFIKKISNEVALSTGSACSAGEPSYVIQALGLGEKVNKVLRVSINKYTTKDDITSFLELLRSI